MTELLLYMLPVLIIMSASVFKERKTFDCLNIIIIIVLGMCVRFFGILLEASYASDIACFNGWADMLFKDGFGSFYSAVDEASNPIFTDYPPGYMYVLWAIGFLRTYLAVENGSLLAEMLVKLPAITADIVTSVFIYKIGKKYYMPDTGGEETVSYVRKILSYTPFVAALLYALNPAVIIDSAVWGQVDSVHTLTLVLTVYFLLEKKYLRGFIVFVVAALIKPQSLMISPIVIYIALARLYDIYNENKDLKAPLLKFFTWFAVCAGAGVFLLLPFSVSGGVFDPTPVIDQYKATLASYPYASVNAYNFYALFGLNWKPVTYSVGFISLETLGYIFICGISVFSFYMLLRNKSKANVFYTAAALCICTFMLSVKMHERYAFPVMVFMLLSYLYKRDKKILALYILYSLSFALHYFDIINLSVNGFDYALIKQTMPTIAFINVVLLIAFVVVYFKTFVKTDKTESGETLNFTEPEPVYISLLFGVKKEKSAFALQKSGERAKYSKKDVGIIAAVTLIYAFVAFFNLGDKFAPESESRLEAGETVEIEFHDSVELGKIQYMLGARDHRPFTVYVTDENTGLDFSIYVEANSVFKWEENPLYISAKNVSGTDLDTNEPFNVLVRTGAVSGLDDDTINMKDGVTNETAVISGTDINTGQYFEFHVNKEALVIEEDLKLPLRAGKLTLEAEKNDTWIQEMAFREAGEEDSDWDIVSVKSVSENGAALFDEQEVVPQIRTYMNGTYFDEVYHARTGYEFVNKEYVYEWTHPPLGKNIIALGIEIFGMTPFGWRFMGTLFGVFMVPLIYFFAMSLFGKTSIAALATVCFTFDFMHFTQTRIATIDTYIVFFVILMYWFMYIYYKMSFYDKSLSKTFVPLGLSGISMGLGVSAKWPGVYAGIGLAILFFTVMGRRLREYFYCGKLKGTDEDSEEFENIRKKFPKYTVATLLFCVVFFVILPTVIYFVAYIPYYATESLYFNRDNIHFLKESETWAKVFKDTPFWNYCAAVVQNQLDIFKYHSQLVSTHPYEAKWFTWIFDLRPIFYYSQTFSDTIRAGLSSFGNPAVWWGGLAALVYGIVRWFKTRDKLLFFLIIGYFAQLVPWLFISRTTYIYHYFPCIPFLVMFIGYFFYEAERKKKFYWATVITVIALFAAFYPLISGMPVNFRIAKQLLEWFTGMWQLI